MKIFKSTISADTLIALRTNKAYVSGVQYSPQIEFDADDTNEKNGIIGSERTSATNSRMFMDVHDPLTGDWKGGLYLVTNGNDAWAECPKRTYDASNINDIVTIGSLQASSDVVHRTGNEYIEGIKDHKSYGSLTKPPINAKFTSSIPVNNDQSIWLMGCYDNSDVELGRLFIRMLTNGTSQLRAELRNSDGTYKVVTLAAGDVI